MSLKKNSLSILVFFVVSNAIFFGFDPWESTNVVNATTGSDNCNIESSGDDCCKCETGSMCLNGDKYRTCVNGCYQEKKCPTIEPKAADLCSQIKVPCPSSNISQACTNPGSIINTSKTIESDGAPYLRICQTNSETIDLRCGLTLVQREAAACYSAKNGSSDGAPNGVSLYKTTDTRDLQNIKTIFTVYDSATGASVNCDDILNKVQGDIADMPKLNSETKNDYPGKAEIKNLSDYYAAKARITDLAGSLNDLELACCLTNDHCQSYGCDQNIVYDWYYGCTKIDFGKVFTNSKQGKIGDCDVCAPGTYGCGSGISSAGNYKACTNRTSTSQNLACWSIDKKCNPADAKICAQDNYCAQFNCSDTSKPAETQTWDDEIGTKNAVWH